MCCLKNMIHYKCYVSVETHFTLYMLSVGNKHEKIHVECWLKSNIHYTCYVLVEKHFTLYMFCVGKEPLYMLRAGCKTVYTKYTLCVRQEHCTLYMLFVG